jgi:hypothetical protein
MQVPTRLASMQDQEFCHEVSQYMHVHGDIQLLGTRFGMGFSLKQKQMTVRCGKCLYQVIQISVTVLQVIYMLNAHRDYVQ